MTVLLPMFRPYNACFSSVIEVRFELTVVSPFSQGFYRRHHYKNRVCPHPYVSLFVRVDFGSIYSIYLWRDNVLRYLGFPNPCSLHNTQWCFLSYTRSCSLPFFRPPDDHYTTSSRRILCTVCCRGPLEKQCSLFSPILAKFIAKLDRAQHYGSKRHTCF